MIEKINYYVVFDANVLIKDFWMKSEGFQYLLTHSFLQHKPVIPKIAFLEASNHLRNRVETLIRKKDENNARTQGNLGNLVRLFNFSVVPDEESWDVDTLVSRWESFMESTIASFGGEILETPKVDVEKIAERSLKRIKPFTKSDKGFRDTLIWLSTLDLVQEDTRVSFITANTNDFFKPHSKEPDPDIALEAKNKLERSWEMRFHRSVDEFIAEFDGDKETSSQALRRAAITNNLHNLDIWDWVECNLESKLDGYDFDDPGWAGTPYDAENIQLYIVEELISLDIPQVRHKVDDIYYIYCDLSIIGNFSCDIGFNSAESIVRGEQILWKKVLDSVWTKVGLRTVASFLVRLEFDVKSSTILGSAIRPFAHWRDYNEEIESLELDEEFESELGY